MNDSNTISIPMHMHNLAQYRCMFDLAQVSVSAKILDLNAGFSSFNLEFATLGGEAVSCDTRYQLSLDDITHHADTLQLEVAELLSHHPQQFNWSEKSAGELLATYDKATQLFLHDYEKGCQEARYQPYTTHELTTEASPFEQNSFNLALINNPFFEEAHSLEEMERQLISLAKVAGEVRLFPLIDTTSNTTQLLAPLMQQLQTKRLGVELREVNYELQKGANAMLRVWSRECLLEP